MTEKCQIRFQEYTTASEHKIAHVTLDAQSSLNALTLDMIDTLYEQLLQWKSDKSIAVLLLDGAGEKAFCAGGDIRQLHRSVIENDFGVNPYGEAFFSREYQLDYLIHTYPKPVLCWGSGIVMGGGIGLMAGASHRVVTPSSKLAMPEVSIGLFPDVGGSWILGRMPGRIGLFLGLTGTRINAADALFCGMADRYLDSTSLPQVLEALQGAHWSHDDRGNHIRLSGLLRSLEEDQALELPESSLQKNFSAIQQVTDADTPQEVLAGIRRQNGEWWQRAGDSLEKGCPLTAGLVFEQLARSRHLSLADVFRMELNMAVNCLRGPNFAEGVRALLLERGSQPSWRPASLEQVNDADLRPYFHSLWSDEEHPLVNL
ncbi:enoyl-CoA hydratase/isomerase family protein [Sansalvadorimonas verongulae]|uniref:enoyl-CoA hydratase/isomerase family protein n=1 Tax=Sansalvadorimonas verongulae TaxID=2172824 RepID=UPI0012BC6A76|nr:enoyl-CoA hydratase/isomerase family protein [Sansalvadorimonas verongulae]MTI14104.1 enoyl-CoA hydratase/isomerase family protein [Sansalvadorimonas verongulae]